MSVPGYATLTLHLKPIIRTLFPSPPPLFYHLILHSDCEADTVTHCREPSAGEDEFDIFSPLSFSFWWRTSSSSTTTTTYYLFFFLLLLQLSSLLFSIHLHFYGSCSYNKCCSGLHVAASSTKARRAMECGPGHGEDLLTLKEWEKEGKKKKKKKCSKTGKRAFVYCRLNGMKKKKKKPRMVKVSEGGIPFKGRLLADNPWHR